LSSFCLCVETRQCTTTAASSKNSQQPEAKVTDLNQSIVRVVQQQTNIKHEREASMGTYLSTPVLDKTQDFGECGGDVCAWGLTEMQGWRQSMEDAALARQFGTGTAVFGVFDGHGGSEVAAFCALYFCSVLALQQQVQQQQKQEQQQPRPAPISSPGEILVRTFHALDQLLVDRYHEVLALKSHPPMLGEQRRVEDDPITYTDLPAEEVTTDSIDDIDNGVDVDAARQIVVINNNNNTSSSSSISSNGDSSSDDGTNDMAKDDDSLKVMGKKDTTVDLDDDLEEEEEDDDAELRTDDDVDVDVDVDDNDKEKAPTEAQIQGILQRMFHQRPPVESRSVDQPSVLHNGQVVCNLPSHSITAGCAAIVAWLLDDGARLVVANAGDSRGVLCRQGSALPVSTDHKPSLPGETARIEKAGGFVNSLGRVNGNLNLSRGIGDLKYKQNPLLSAAEQMITGEPDIIDVKLTPGEDEFFMLGCDGIWDCLSNQEAVDFVKTRINDQSPADIGAAMVDSIIAKIHPKNTQGIGGDNMTILIVDLLPRSRSYTTNTMVEV
jgi:serine/threonine protein phosphatase PrpC